MKALYPDLKVVIKDHKAKLLQFIGNLPVLSKYWAIRAGGELNRFWRSYSNAGRRKVYFFVLSNALFMSNQHKLFFLGSVAIILPQAA